MRLPILSVYILSKHAFGLKADLFQALLYIVPALFRSFFEKPKLANQLLHMLQNCSLQNLYVFTLRSTCSLCVLYKTVFNVCLSESACF